MVFQIRLADQTIKMETLYPAVYEMCRPYLYEGAEVDMEIQSTRELIEREGREAEPGGRLSASYLETLAVYRQIAEKMLDHNTFLMHGSVVAAEGRAFMFTAAQGVGKTTRTRAWLGQLEHSFVINGDKPLIRVAEKEVIAYGSPWAGKEGLNTNQSLPLKAIFFLERAENTSLQKLSFSEAFPRLLRQAYRSQKAEQAIKGLSLLKKMEDKTDFYLYRSSLKDLDMKWLYREVMK